MTTRLAALYALAGGLALGCSADLEQFSTDADTGSTHALITIERSATVDGATARAEALAGFVRVPADVESKPLYHLLGLRDAVGTIGQCRARAEGPESTPALSGIGRVELLPVGEIVVGVAGNETTLAPHAFPTVTDAVSGVVYTSRDRSADLLPARARYVVRTSGPEGAALTVTHDAPADLEAVHVGGVALGELAELSTRDGVELTWAAGASGDLVVVSLSSADESSEISCTFRDDLGAGTVPAGSFVANGPGRLSLRRLRTSSFTASGVDVGQLGFDFELVAPLTFQ